MSATHGDYVIWQRRAHALLGKFIDRCYREGLPVIHWRIGLLGGLAGECLATDTTVRRADFEAWVRALDLERRPERTHNGITRLSAGRSDLERVGVVITADIYTDEEVGR
jgi:hypothetical protein